MSEEQIKELSEEDVDLLKNIDSFLGKIKELNVVEKKEDEQKFHFLLKEYFNTSIDEILNLTLSYINQNVDEIAEEFSYIVPDNDWNNMLRSKEDKVNFIKSRVMNHESWGFHDMDLYKDFGFKFVFYCLIIEEGRTLEANYFMSFRGKTKAILTKVND